MTSSDYLRHGTTTLNVAIGRVADACTEREVIRGPRALVGQVLRAYSRQRSSVAVNSYATPAQPAVCACLIRHTRVQLLTPTSGFWLDLVKALLPSTARQVLQGSCKVSHVRPDLGLWPSAAGSSFLEPPLCPSPAW